MHKKFYVLDNTLQMYLSVSSLHFSRAQIFKLKEHPNGGFSDINF